MADSPGYGPPLGCPAARLGRACPVTRVLVLSNMYPPHHYGGYELSCRDVMDRLVERGHSTAVLTTTMRVPGVADDAGEDERGIWRRLRFAWDDHVLQSPPLLRRAAAERHNQRALIDALERFEPDVVSVWNMGAMSLGLLETLARRDVPVVLNVCDDWLIYGPDLDPWARLFRRRPRLVGRLAEVMARVPARLPDLSAATALFVSEFTRDRSIAHAAVQMGRSTVVWSGIDERDFPVEPPHPPRAWDWRLLGVGRIDERKGIEVAVRALALLPPEASLRWLGQGEQAEQERLVRIANELGVADRITWGAAPRHELRDAYHRADVVVFPSTWGEPFGLVPVEAMACGTAVIGTGVGGSGEFLLDGTSAVLVPPGDPTALARAVRRLAADGTLRASVIAGGTKVATELTIDRLADTVEAWHVAAAEGFPNGEPPQRALTLT